MSAANQTMSWLLTNRRTLIQGFWWIQLLLLAFVITTYYLPQFRPSWGWLGHRAADLSVIFFVLSIAPGIMKRLGVHGIMGQIQLGLMSFRRQTGIAVFIFGFHHYLYARVFRMLSSGNFSLPSTPFEIAGAIALGIAFLLFVTSNDYSIRMLGKAWKNLHVFTHIIGWAILTHLILFASWGWQTALMALAITATLLSWIKASMTK